MAGFLGYCCKNGDGIWKIPCFSDYKMHTAKIACHVIGIVSVVIGIVAFGCDCCRGWLLADEFGTLDGLGAHVLAVMMTVYSEIAISFIGCIVASVALYKRAFLVGGIGLGMNLTLAARTLAIVYFGAM
jgi:hypothetical protein